MLNRVLEFFNYNSADPIQFNSPIFLVFITLVFLGYPFVVGKIKLRTVYLLLFSLFFFYKTSGVFWLLLLGTALVNYLLGRLIFKNPKDAKLYLILSIIWNIGSLSYFKYTNYLIEGFNFLANGQVKPLDIIFPAGISFFTFQTMSYTIDIYRKKLKPVNSFLDFSFFVSFFPQLVAGPIVRAADFLPQINKRKTLSNNEISQALMLILNGLFKKMVIADFLAVNYIQNIFANPTGFDGFTNLIAVYAYAIKIYCDFSAYSDMAIGLAKLLGFNLLENFNLPYKATSVKDFWSRWHISLSTWLRDYLYIPLGGNRKGNVYLNLMITMLLGGLWHVRPNAFWTYLTWGALHGIALVIHRRWSQTKIALLINNNKLFSFFYKPLAWLITFNFISLTWVFFRANSLENAWIMLQAIFGNLHLANISNWVSQYQVIGFVLIASYLFHFIPTSWDYKLIKPISKLGLVGHALLISLSLIFFSEFKRFEPFLGHVVKSEITQEKSEKPQFKVQQFEYYKF
ncbi:MBOAT family protein [bacterium]|nr:MBOAT family protein [bacterium]